MTIVAVALRVLLCVARATIVIAPLTVMPAFGQFVTAVAIPVHTSMVLMPLDVGRLSGALSIYVRGPVVSVGITS